MTSAEDDDWERVPQDRVVEGRKVSLTIGGNDGAVDIYRAIDLAVSAGEWVAVVGPSGCGKTMFLNTVAGLETPTEGELEVFGERPRVGRRDVGYFMARDALLPWRTALENVCLSLEAQGVPKSERLERAEGALAMVRLGQFKDAYRAELSQGMRQRVALARTLVTNPRLLLLDEPFAALDAQTRIVMQEMLLKVLQAYRGTVFLVTHDLAEAIVLADRVLVFSRRPAHVKAEVRIDLPRPRDAFTVRSSLQFQRLQADVWEQLADEVSQDESE